MNDQTNHTQEHMAFSSMQSAYEFLKTAKPSRENSLVITKLEEAMMWCKKDRIIKGELIPGELM